MEKTWHPPIPGGEEGAAQACAGTGVQQQSHAELGAVNMYVAMPHARMSRLLWLVRVFESRF